MYQSLTHIHICVPSSSPWCSVPWSTETRRSRRSSLSTWRLWPRAPMRPSASLTLRRSLHFSLSLFCLSFLSHWAGWNWSRHSAMARWSHVKVESKTATHSCGVFFTLTARGGWTSSPAWLHTLWGAERRAAHRLMWYTCFSPLFFCRSDSVWLFVKALLCNACQESMRDGTRPLTND